jgi:hypothetical protein
LRHILFLAMLGIGVVFLAGPVIAVASIVLSLVLTVGVIVIAFALVGFLVWAPFYVLYAGREAASEKIGNMGRAIGITLRRLVHIGGRAVTVPAHFMASLFRSGLRMTVATARFVGEVGMLGLVGAAIGAALGLALSGSGNQDPAQAVPLNALVGGGIASVAGVVMALLSRRATPRRSLAA